MPNDPYLEDSSIAANRRAHSRQKLHSVAYIDLGPTNGGLVLNLSESGLALSTAMKLMGDELPNMRFRLPGLDEAIQASARVVWMSQSKKEAGVRFEELPASDARRINEWILAEQGLNARLEQAAVSDGFDDATSPEPPFPDTAASQPSVHEPAVMESQALDSEEGPSDRTSSGQTEDLVLEPLGSLRSQTNIETPGEQPNSDRKWAFSAAIIAVIAVVSFGTGVVIERRVQNGTTTKADGSKVTAAAEVVDEKAAPSAAPPPAQSANTEIDKQDFAVGDNSGPTSTAGKAPISERSTPASERANVQEELGTKTTRPGKTPDAANKSATAELANAPRVDVARKSEPFSTKIGVATQGGTNPGSGTSRRIAEPKRTEATAPGAKAVQSASELALPARQGAKDMPQASTTAKAADLPVAPPTATQPTPSIVVRRPPFPSMRIPPEMKSQASRGGMSLQMGQLMSRAEPTYPPEAVRQGITGSVKVHAAIGPDGVVQSVEANGPTILAEAAMNAVRQWRYKPTLLGGQAVEADEEIVFVFRLSSANP